MNQEFSMRRAVFAINMVCLFWDFSASAQTVLRLNDTEKSFVLRYQNELRASTKSTAMFKLVWSAKLEQLAADHAAQCSYENTPSAQKHTKVAGFPNVGENLYAAPGQGRPQLKPAVDWWWSEWSSYNHNLRTCAPGQSCNHFLQIAWNRTMQVGCAMSMCADIKGTNLSRGGQLIVCEYGPAANLAGEAPYEKQAAQGAACSKCATTFANYKTFCTPEKLCDLIAGQ